MRSPNECSLYFKCSAPLCPLDPELKSRNWFIQEPICRKYHTRSIRKQKAIHRRQPKSYLWQPLTILDLIKISRPKKFTEAQLEAMCARLANTPTHKQKAMRLQQAASDGPEPMSCPTQDLRKEAANGNASR